MVERSDSWIPGYRFQDGRLLVFEPERVTLVDVWPDQHAARKEGDGPWRPFHPEFRLVRPYRPAKAPAPPAARQQLLPLALPPTAPTRLELAAQKRRAFDALRFALPRELARAVERFRCGQFAMLRLFRAAPAFLDLLVSNPPLAFFLADRLGRGEVAAADRGVVAQKQTEIAARLGFPATPAAVRTLRKVAPESLTPESAADLQQALADAEACGRMAHRTRINAGVVRLLGDARLRAAAAPALLDEVAADAREKYRAVTADLLEDVLALERELRGDDRVPTFTSIARVRAAHHAISQEYFACRRSGILDCRFPPPPLCGTADIVPLTAPRDLIAEGCRQRNCVASYAPAVARGGLYVYRVLRPQRATLALRRGSGGRWFRAELLAACNTHVDLGTVRAVDRWLDERTVSA